MKCKYCDTEMIELELCDLGYGQRYVEYECPYQCDYLRWLEEQEELNE